MTMDTLTPKPYEQNSRVGQQAFLPGGVTNRALSQLVIIDSPVFEIPAFIVKTGWRAVITSVVTSTVNDGIRIAPVPFTLLLFEGSAINERKMVGFGDQQTNTSTQFLPPQPLPQHGDIAGSDGNNAVYTTAVYQADFAEGGGVLEQSYCGIAQARVLLPIGGQVTITNTVELHNERGWFS